MVNMNVIRAHEYDHVSSIRNELKRLPKAFSELVQCGFIIYPNSLSPVFTGLMVDELDCSYDRKYSTVGGWYLGWEHENWTHHPHVFLTPNKAWAAVHECMHAIDDALGFVSDMFFKPHLALYEYMATDADEYFACAGDAFLTSENIQNKWNRKHLAKSDPDIFGFFKWLQERTGRSWLA